MRKITIDLRRSLGWNYNDIKDLLSELGALDSMVAEDDVTLFLPQPEKHRISELALSILWSKLREFQEFPAKKKLVYSTKSVDYFNDRHFFDRLTLSDKTSRSSAKIPLHFETFTLAEDENDTANKIVKSTLKNIGKMPLGSEVNVHILELVSNAFHHSQAGGDVGCVSRFDLKAGNFEFCITDQGRGIKKTFQSNKSIWGDYSHLSDPDLIEMATNQYVTCNPKIAPQYAHGNAGIGLYFLREFCKHHKGYLVVLSGKGYYYIDKQKVKKRNIPTPWSGTAVLFGASLNNQISEEYMAVKDRWMEEFDKSMSMFKFK